MKNLKRALFVSVVLASSLSFAGVGDSDGGKDRRGVMDSIETDGGGAGSIHGAGEMRGVMDGAGEMRSRCHFNQQFSICK